MYRNQWGILRWAGAELLMTVTLSLVTLLPTVLVVSEPMSSAAGGAWPARA
jgi:hypothetical protein